MRASDHPTCASTRFGVRGASRCRSTRRVPLPLKTVSTTNDWQAIGIRRYPVIEIPIEFRVDDVWPNDNHEETFSLVLSGMHGFGAPGVASVIRRQIRKT